MESRKEKLLKRLTEFFNINIESCKNEEIEEKVMDLLYEKYLDDPYSPDEVHTTRELIYKPQTGETIKLVVLDGCPLELKLIE